MENTTIPLNFDISALQGQLDDVVKIMNNAFGSFGGKGQFKSFSTAMNSFKGSFGVINKSLKSIDVNLGSLVANMNTATSKIQSANKEIDVMQKGTINSAKATEKLISGFSSVEKEVSDIQSMLNKPLSLDINLGETDLVGPLERQLKQAEQKINQAYKLGTPTGKETISFVDETKIKDDVKVFENAYSEIKNSSDAMITYVRGTTRDILKHPMNSIEQFQNLWTRVIYNLQSHKMGREAVPLFTLTGSELGPISAAIEKLAEFRKARRGLDVESLKSFENKPFDELAKSLNKSGVAYDELIEAARAFNVLEVTGDRHIDANVKRTKEYRKLEKATLLYTDAIAMSDIQMKRSGKISDGQTARVAKLKLAMDEARKAVTLKGEIVSVNALAGTLENLGDVAGTKVTAAFHKLAGSSKELGPQVWAKVFEARDIEGFQKAIVVLESKLKQVGKSNPKIEALYKNFSNIKQIAETHFAAKMSAEFEEGALKSEKEIGKLYSKITKLQSQVAKGELPQSALVGPFKALSKEVESLIKRSQVLNTSLDQIEQSGAPSALRYEEGAGPRSVESRDLTTIYNEGVSEKQVSSLSSLQSGLRGVADQLIYANTELKVSEAAWVSWGEVRKKTVFDLRKVTSEFEVPVESVSRTDVSKRHRQYADYQKQIDSLVKKRKLLGMVDKSSYSESFSQMKKVVSGLPQLNNLQEKGVQIARERKALLEATAGKERTPEQVAYLEKLKKQYKEVKVAETEVANTTILIANEMDVLASKSAFSPTDVARIAEFATELHRIDSLIKTISGKPISISADVEALQRSLGAINKDSVPIKAKITVDQKAIDNEINALSQKFHAAMAKTPEVRTETKTKTALQTVYSTQNAIGKMDKQLVAMVNSANVALRNIRMDEALDPKEAEQLMKPLQNLISEFTELQEDILLIDESLTKLGSNPTEEQMQKTWSQLEPVFTKAYEKMNLFSGVYDNLSKKQGGATAATNNMVSSLERLMQKPVQASRSFDALADSLLRAQGIAGKTDLAKQLKSPDKAVREYAEKISVSIEKARSGLDVVAGEALSPEANEKIKQSIKRAEENYVKQVAEAQKRARRKLESLIKKAEAGPESKRKSAIGSAEAAFDKEVGTAITLATSGLEREKERILDVPVKLKPSVEADLVLNKWKSVIQALVTEFGQGGNLAARRFQEMYASTSGGFNFDQALYSIASKTKSLLGQTGSFFKTMGSRSGDVLPLEEFDQLIKKQKEFQKAGAISTTVLNPIIKLGSVVSNTANVFDKMKLAVKTSAAPEVIEGIQKEIDQFIQLRQISKDSTAQLSQQSKETRGLGFTMEKFGYAIDLLIQYLEKAINKFQGLGKTAHSALRGIGSGLKGQAGLFKSSLVDVEGPMFDIKPEGFKLAKPLEAMFSEVYNSSLIGLQDLRKVTDKGLSAWSVSFKGGLSKTDKVVKQNGSALIGGLSKIRRGIKVAATSVNWGEILDPEGAKLLRKSATGASLQLKEFQADLAKLKTGKISKVSAFPTIKALQTQLKTVLSVSEEVQRKLAAGELGMEHFPAVDRLQQYALQLTAAIDMIEKPYKSMAGLAGKEEKISSKQLGKSFRSGITGAQKELEDAVKQVKAPMKSVMVRLFEDVLSMTPTEIPQAAGMMRKLAEQFPSQMQSALNSMGKKKYEIGKFIAKMFDVDPSEFKTVEEALEKRGAEIPTMLLKAIFPTEGQAKFAADAKKMANQIITAPLNKALRSAGNVTMPKFEVFRIGDDMMREAKFEGAKFSQVKSQYGTYVSSLINDINNLMKVSPSKTMRPILEKIFNTNDVNDINAYANGMKGALSNIKDYLQKAVSGKLPKEQLAAGLGLQEELKKAGLEVDEDELSQMFEQMYKMAGQSLKDFVAQEKNWSSNSVKDLIMLMEYWENLGGMVDMVTKKIPKVSNMKNISETMFKDKGSDSVAAGRDMARLMVKGLESTLSEGSGIKQPLAAMIGKSPEVIFEIMRGTNQKLKNELKDLGFNLRGSTTDLVKSIKTMGEVDVDTSWFERYRIANEQFYLESEKTGVVLKKIRDGFNTITPLSSEGLSELATRSQDYLTRAGIAFESFDAKLFRHSVKFNAFSEKEKANVGKYTNILSKGMRTIGQFLQEDPFSGSIMRLVREESVLWEKLIVSADKGGKKLKTSIQSELASALDTTKREGINLDRLFKGTGKVPELQEIIGQLMELRKTKRAVDAEMMAPSVRPFSNLIKDASMLQGTLLTAFGSISQGLSRVGEKGKVDVEMGNSIRNLDTVTQHLNVLQAEIDETIEYAKKTGQVLPIEFQLVARSVAEMGSSLNSSYDVLKKLPTHANVSEKEMEELAVAVNKSTSALKKFDQIDLKEFSSRIGVSMSVAMNKVNAFSKQAQIRPSFQLGKTGIDQMLKATGSDSDKMIQQWRESAVAGGDSWKQMTMFLKELEPEMKGIFERFASKPRLMLKAFEKMTPQMRILMSLYFDQMGHSTAEGFKQWMQTYDQYFSGMTKTNKRHLETFLGYTSQTMSAFKAPDVTKYFAPETGLEADKTTDGLKRLGNALAKLGVNMQDLKKLSGDTDWLTKWGEAFAKPIKWDFGPGKGKEIQLTGTFSMFAKAITHVGEGLDILMTQLHRVGEETQSGAIQKGIKQLITLIMQLDAELSKTSKFKLSIGAGLSTSLKPLRDVGYAINSFFDAMERIKVASDFTLSKKEIATFGITVKTTMSQIATMMAPATDSLRKFADTAGVKRFSQFAQGIRDLVVATKELYQLTAIFSAIEKDSKTSGIALQHFENVVKSMMVLLKKIPDTAKELRFGVSDEGVRNARALAEVLKPLAQSMLLISESFKKGVNIKANMDRFAAGLKGMVRVIASIDLDPVTRDLLNDVRKLTQIFSSKALVAAPDEAEKRLQMLARVVEQGSVKVAQKVKTGGANIEKAIKKDFITDLMGGIDADPGKKVEQMQSNFADALTGFSEPIPNFDGPEQSMSHLAGAGKEVGKVLQVVNSALTKLGAEFKTILPGEEKFIAELVQLAALNPAAAIDKLTVKLNSLGKNLVGDSLKKSQTAIQGFIIELLNGAASLKSMGAAGVDLQKIHDGLNKDTISAKDLTIALAGVKGVLHSVESESAKLDLQNRLLKTRGEAKGVHTEIKGLLLSMRKMGPEFKKSLSTGDARREFLSYANELGSKLETAMGPMRAFTGFKGVSEEIKKMTSSMSVLKSQSQGMVTLADRFTGKLRIAGDQFLNLVAYQTRWYVSQQIFFMGFGQLEKILSNFGALDLQVRRVLRVLRDSNNAVLGIDSSIRALSGAGVSWASEWAKNMEVMFKAQTRTTFYNLFKTLGATSEEIGESLYQLGSAGLQANEAMSAIEPTLRMIIATEGEVKDTTRLIAGVFNLYGDSIEGARTNTEKFVYITDVLTATFRDHMVTIGELITGISYTIATAKLSGMQFEEVTAALAILNDNMLKGSKAGRAFNRMLLNSTKRLDETKKILQTIGDQANIGVDLSKIFEGLEAKGAKPFDYIIEAGIAMQDQLKTANLTTESLTKTFKAMGVVGARSFAILLLKAGDYRKTLFQLKYAAFSAGEDMSNLLIGGFDRSIHRIEGFTRAGYARLMGVARGGITVLASSVQSLENGIRKISDLKFIPDVPDIKSYISFFGIIATGAAILAGMKQKSLPGMDVLRVDKAVGAINTFIVKIEQNRNALKNLNVDLARSGQNAMSMAQAYERASSKMSAASKAGSAFSFIRGMKGSVEGFSTQQQFVVSGLKDIERAFAKVSTGKWSMGDLSEFKSTMGSLKEFESTFAMREKEFVIKTNLARVVSELREGTLSTSKFGERLNLVHKEIIRASGVSKLTSGLDALEREFKEGTIDAEQFTNSLRKLGLEANKLGKIKTFGLEAISTKGFADSFKGMENIRNLYTSNMKQMSAMGIDSMDQVHKLVQDPRAWNKFEENVQKSYSSWDRETQKASNKFRQAIDASMGPMHKATAGISIGAMEADFVKQTKSMSMFRESWEGLAEGIGLSTDKLSKFWGSFKGMIGGSVKHIRGLGTEFDRAIAKREALLNLRSGFKSMGSAVVGLGKSIGTAVSSMGAMAIYAFVFQQIFQWIEKLTRGTEYWAQQLGTTNAEFNKSFASLTGNISGIMRYVDKLVEIRDLMETHIKVDVDVKSEEFEQDLNQLRGLLEGTAEFENFEFHIKHGDVVDATRAWAELNKVITNLRKGTTEKAIGRFVELGGEYRRAAEIYKETMKTSIEGSSVKSFWDTTRGNAPEQTLQFTTADWGHPDKIKFKRQGQEAAKLMLDASKVMIQQGATSFNFIWDKSSLTTFDKSLNETFESAVLFGDSVDDTNKKFSRFINSIKQGAKTAELFDEYKEVGENLNEVFRVKGADEFATFMKMFPNLASDSKEEIKGMADGWASMGKDQRAVVLISAARKDLKAFHLAMKAISSDGSMLQAAGSTKRFVEVAANDISKLNTTISQMGGIVASQFEKDWDRTWGSWVINGTTAAIDIEKALSGSFAFGAESVLGKLERSISKTTVPIVKSFTDAYTTIGSTWAKEASIMIGNNKLPETFASWGNRLKIALSDPWAKSKQAQDEWRSGMNNSVEAAMMRFKLLRDSMSQMGGLVAEEWRRAQSSIVSDKFGSKEEGENAVEDFSKGMEKSLKEAIKSGHKEIQSLAKAMSGDVTKAIDLTVKRMEALNKVIAQAKDLSIEVYNAMSNWQKGASLTNKVLAVTMDYLKKFTESADMSKTVRDLNTALIEGEKRKAKEAYERGKSLSITDEDKIKNEKKYFDALNKASQQYEALGVERFKKHIADKDKAEKKAMDERHKREEASLKTLQGQQKTADKNAIDSAKKRLRLEEKVGKLKWRTSGDKASTSDKVSDETAWSKQKTESDRHNRNVLQDQKDDNTKAMQALKEKHAKEKKDLAEEGGKTAAAVSEFAKILIDVKSGELNINGIDELTDYIASLNDVELTKVFNEYASEIKGITVEMATVDASIKEITEKAKENHLEAKRSLDDLVSLQKKLTGFSQTVAEQSKVIAELLKREGLSQAIQALSAVGFDVAIGEEGKFKDEKTLDMFNKLIGSTSEGLVDAANKLQVHVQGIKAFAKEDSTPKTDIASDISKQLLNFSESFPEASSHIDELSSQFLIQLKRMKASGKTQEEIDSRLGTVLNSITAVSEDAENLDSTAVGSYLDDITNMLKITSNDLKQVDVSDIQPETTKTLLQAQIVPTESEAVLKKIQENQVNIDTFVEGLPQWNEVAEEVKKTTIASYEKVNEGYREFFDVQSKAFQKEMMARGDLRLYDGELQAKKSQVDVTLGELTPVDISKVIDADTIKVNDIVVNLRLAFIDALESMQAGGALQTEDMKNLIDEYKKSGYDIQAFFREYDEKTNRLIATLYATKGEESIDINQEAIARGIAKVFIPNKTLSSTDHEIVQGYSDIQEAAKQMSAGIHGFSQWLSTTYPNMTMQLPENFREIIGRGDETDIRTILENESKLKSALNEYSALMGKSPLYTDKDMSVTDEAVQELLKLGSTKGSIFVHDTHLEKSLKSISDLFPKIMSNMTSDLFPEAVSVVAPGPFSAGETPNEITNTVNEINNKVQDATSKIESSIGQVGGEIFDNKTLLASTDAISNTFDLLNQTVSDTIKSEKFFDPSKGLEIGSKDFQQKLSDVGSSAQEIFSSIQESLNTEQLSSELKYTGPEFKDSRPLLDYYKPQDRSIQEDTGLPGGANASFDGESYLLEVGNYMFKINRFTEEVSKLSEKKLSFDVTLPKFYAQEYKIPKEDVQGLSEGIIRQMEAIASRDVQKYGVPDYKENIKSSMPYGMIDLEGRADIATIRSTELSAAAIQQVVRDAKSELSSFSEDSTDQYKVLLGAVNKIEEIKELSQQTETDYSIASYSKKEMEARKNIATQIENYSKLLPPSDKFHGREDKDSSFTEKLKSSLKPDIDTKNLSMEVVNGITLITESLKNSSGAIEKTVHGFSSLDEAIAKLGASTISALQTKQQEQTFEKANPQHKAAFYDPEKPKITYEVQSAQDFIPELTGSIKAFKSILTGVSSYSDVGFTTGRQAEEFKVSQGISEIMSTVEDTFGETFTTSLTNALPALGEGAASEMVKLGHVMSELKNAYESKGKAGSEVEIRDAFRYLKDLGSRALTTSTQTGNAYQPQAQQFSNVATEMQAGMGPEPAQYAQAAQAFIDMSTKAKDAVTSILSKLQQPELKTPEVDSALQNFKNEVAITSAEFDDFSVPNLDLFNNVVGLAADQLQFKMNNFTIDPSMLNAAFGEISKDLLGIANPLNEKESAVGTLLGPLDSATNAIDIFGSELSLNSENVSSTIKSAIETINSTAVNSELVGESEVVLSETISSTSQALSSLNSDIQSSTSSVDSAFSNVISAANSAASAMASIQRSGARTGTVLPGYGGGDSLPFNLEPGEAVINKEAVRMYGRDLFSAYNQGKAGAVSMPSVGNRLTKVRSVVEKKLLNDDSPIRKFDISLAGVPFKGLATEDMINQLEKGLKRKQLVGQNI